MVSSDDGNLTLEQLTSANPMPRLFALGRANKILQDYKDQRLDQLDVRLLKGFYIEDKTELEPIREKIKKDLDFKPKRLPKKLIKGITIKPKPIHTVNVMDKT